MTVLPSQGYIGQNKDRGKTKPAEQVKTESVYYHVQTNEMGMSDDLESNVLNVQEKYDSDIISHHKPSTLFIQAVFFLLKMMENIISLVSAVSLLPSTIKHDFVRYHLILF